MSTGFHVALQSGQRHSQSDSSTDHAERRRATRHPCDGGSIRVLVFLGPEACSATLRDISVGGIGILVDAIVAPGDRLNIELHNPANGAWCCKSVEVIHSKPAARGRWLVGSAFSPPLSTHELRPLLPARRAS
jgi:hypothetical protein